MKTKKKRNAQNIIFTNILLANICVFLVVLFTVTGFLIRNSFEVLKISRLEVLEQQAGRNQIFNKAIKYLAEDLYLSFGSKLSTVDEKNSALLEQEIEDTIEEKSKMLRGLEIFPGILIMMKDGYTFHTGVISEEEVKNISLSYWYIYNTSHPKGNLWTSRYDYTNHDLKMEISYGRSITNSDGEYLGIILVSMSADFLERFLIPSTEDGTVRYIIDKNGTAISHSIPTLLGGGLYYMPYFWSQFEPDSSKLLRKNTNTVLHTNYYDKETGWTIVEEKSIDQIWMEFSEIIAITGILLLFAILLSVVMSFLLAKRIAKPIVMMTNQMIEPGDDIVSKVDSQVDYKEVLVLSNIYNMTVEKMNQLILKTREDEKKKRKLELLFLQAQMNPHFLHNTLFSIKCLNEMKKYEKANVMISNLMKMLKMPINVSKEWIGLEDEIVYLQSYISLMQTRYEKRNIKMEFAYGENIKKTLIPRLMLQPIVENSIFHGFDDETGNAVISIEVTIVGEHLIIRIRDNGKGMSEAELDNLWNASEKNSKVFNRIGLANIQQRIKLLYGPDCGMMIMSQEGEGTETILNLRCMIEEELDV